MWTCNICEITIDDLRLIIKINWPDIADIHDVTLAVNTNETKELLGSDKQLQRKLKVLTAAGIMTFSVFLETSKFFFSPWARGATTCGQAMGGAVRVEVDGHGWWHCGQRL